MEKKSYCALFLLLFLSLIVACSVATKSAHWQRYEERSLNGLNNLSDTPQPLFYRCLVGLIAVDSWFVLLNLIAMIVVCANKNPTITKVFILLIILTLICRLVLGIIMLAGDDEFGKDRVKWYDDIDDKEKSRDDYNVHERDYWTTLKGAWAYEIICLILSEIVGFAAICVMRSAAKVTA